MVIVQVGVSRVVVGGEGASVIIVAGISGTSRVVVWREGVFMVMVAGILSTSSVVVEGEDASMVITRGAGVYVEGQCTRGV